MDELEDLRKKIESTQTLVKVDVSSSWKAFRQEQRDGDVNAFVDFLEANGLLDSVQAGALTGSAPKTSSTLSAVHVNFNALPQAGAAGADTFDLSAGPPLSPLPEGEGDGVQLPPGLRSHSILGKVGEGGMASVFLAIDQNLRRRVALKQQGIRDEEDLKQFTLEAQVTAQLEHPHIVPIYAFEASPAGVTAYTMKMVEGKTLAQVIEGAKAKPEEGLVGRVEHFLQICDAIDYAHAKGVIHRDLKPANVMIGPFNELYVLDWGLAKLVNQPDPLSSESKIPVVSADADPASSRPKLGKVDVADPATRTVDGVLKGTPLYMAPEQATADLDRIGPHSDQYTLGLILHELINLEPAYVGDDVLKILSAASTAKIRPPNAITPPPPELSAIVNKATSLQPEDRYGSVRKLAKDVRRFLHNQETRALPDDLPRKLRRWVSWNPHKTMALGATLALLVAVAVVVGVARQRVAVAAEHLRSEHYAQATERVLGMVAHRSRALTRDVLWYRGLTEGLARAATLSLERGRPTQEPIYGAEAFTQATTAPADLVHSDHYGKGISPHWPVHRIPPGDAEAAERQVRLLQPLRFPMRDLFRSGPGSPNEAATDEALDGRIVDHEVPMEWLYVAAEATGAMVLFPGAADMGWDETHDPRQRSWYRESRSAWEAGRRRMFSSPYVDQMGQGLVITATQACVGADGAFLGVAALDLSLAYMVETHLKAPEMPGFQRSFILGPNGRVFLSSDSSAESPTRDDGTLQVEEFPFPRALEEILSNHSGLRHEGAHVLAWSRSELGGTFVTVADAAALLDP